MAFYTLIAIACSSLRPLWLDEVIQLTVSRAASGPDFMQRISTNPGAAPLGYLSQRPLALAFGSSLPWPRIPAVLFSVLSFWTLLLVLKELRLCMHAAWLFLLLPLQFRYATEARPYSEAMFFSLLATLGVLKLYDKPRWSAACLTIAASAATLYTQPYAILSVCGVMFWCARQNWKRAAIGSACIAMAVLAFTPWYVMETRAWTLGIHDQGYPPFHWTFGLAADVFKSLSGDGFLCSIALLILIVSALRANSPARGLMLSAVLFSLAGALAGDAFKNYFFASRQILFAVPAVAILATLGFARLYSKSKAIATTVAVILLISALQKDLTMQLNSKEDWPAAARAVSQIANDTGACLQAVPAGTLDLYDLFEPGLPEKRCRDPLPARIALISDLYTYSADLSAATRRLQDLGFLPVQTTTAGGTTITLLNQPR